MTDCQCLYWVPQVSPSFFDNPSILVSIDIRYQAYLLSATYNLLAAVSHLSLTFLSLTYNLWAAVSLFNSFLLDGSIISITFNYFIFIYPLSWIHWFLYLEKTPLFLGEKKPFSSLTFPFLLTWIIVSIYCIQFLSYDSTCGLVLLFWA